MERNPMRDPSHDPTRDPDHNDALTNHHANPQISPVSDPLSTERKFPRFPKLEVVNEEHNVRAGEDEVAIKVKKNKYGL